MKGILSAASAAIFLSTLAASAQSTPATTNAANTNSNAFSQNSNDPNPTAVPGAGMPQTAVTAWLNDPKTGCSARAMDAIQADAVTWSGACDGGWATGKGTMAFSLGGKFSQSVDGTFDKGVLRDGPAVVKWADGSHYEGDAVAGRMDGDGTLTNAAGDGFDGHWKAGLLNGKGVAVWANGDRYEGEWRDGKAEGHGVQHWSDGREYDGDWRNDMPDGHGAIRRKDGSRFEGEFADGRPKSLVPLTEIAAADSSGAAGNDGTNSASPAGASAIAGVAGRKLIAVDGSSLTLTSLEDGFAREIVAPNGSVKKNVFSFLGDKVGAVSDGDNTDNVTGVFRLTEKGIVANYSDGRAETFFPNGDGGVSMTLNAAAGEASCMAWYPEGHRFSIDDRKAALAAYANTLGLAEPARKSSKPSPKPACGSVADAPDASSPEDHHVVADAAPSPHETPVHPLPRPDAPQPTVVAASFTAASMLASTQPIEVRPSTVHLIDNPAPDVAQETASNEPAGATNESASRCLSVESDGQHWGFHNHCGFDVQFAYCLMNAGDLLASCDKGAVTGSVAPNGSSALVVDRSLSETNADHDFRWVACGGGAGEVVVHLDKTDPPAGRCVRTGAS